MFLIKISGKPLLVTECWLLSSSYPAQTLPEPRRSLELDHPRQLAVTLLKETHEVDVARIYLWGSGFSIANEKPEPQSLFFSWIVSGVVVVA